MKITADNLRRPQSTKHSSGLAKHIARKEEAKIKKLKLQIPTKRKMQSHVGCQPM